MWQIKDLELDDFGSVANTGVSGVNFGCVANKGLTEKARGEKRKGVWVFFIGLLDKLAEAGVMGAVFGCVANKEVSGRDGEKRTAAEGCVGGA